MNRNKFRSNSIDRRWSSPDIIEQSGQCFHVEDWSVFFEGKALSKLRDQMKTGVNYNKIICLFDKERIQSLFDQKYVVQNFGFGESWSWGSWDGNMTIYFDGSLTYYDNSIGSCGGGRKYRLVNTKIYSACEVSKNTILRAIEESASCHQSWTCLPPIMV